MSIKLCLFQNTTQCTTSKTRFSFRYIGCALGLVLNQYLKNEPSCLHWPPFHTKPALIVTKNGTFWKSFAKGMNFETRLSVLVWTAKTKLFENVDITTVELAWTQIMCECISVNLNISDEAALNSEDSETIWKPYNVERKHFLFLELKRPSQFYPAQCGCSMRPSGNGVFLCCPMEYSISLCSDYA